MAGMGIFAYPAFVNSATKDTSAMIIAIIVTAVCLVAGFVMELIFYKDDAPASKKAIDSSATVNGEVLLAPLDGEVKPLSEVADQVFSSEAMGKGIAIVPTEGKVYAPADGEVTAFFNTGHAVGITTEKGAQIIIHVGMDTVQLEGQGFSPKVKQGDKVKKGDLLLEFDIDYIKGQGYSVETPVVITNSDKYADIIPTDAKAVVNGNDLITLL